MGPFSSPNGLITATTPDEVCGNPEIMTSGVFDEVVLQRTSSNNWSQVPCPAARTFTKVFVRKIHPSFEKLPVYTYVMVNFCITAGHSGKYPVPSSNVKFMHGICRFIKQVLLEGRLIFLD